MCGRISSKRVEQGTSTNHGGVVNALPQSRVFEGPLAEARLAELGLREEELVNAVRAAEMERRSCSPLEPSTSPGYKAWSTGFRTLAEQLVLRGWEKTETRGLPRLLNPESRIAIALVTGDEGTGTTLVGSGPKSKAPRGTQSVLFVRSNQVQLNLFPGSRQFMQRPSEAEQITWWLLMYSSGNGEVRAELSLPVGLGEDRRLAEWEERIVLHLESGSLEPDSLDDDEPPVELEIDVRPRS